MYLFLAAEPRAALPYVVLFFLAGERRAALAYVVIVLPVNQAENVTAGWNSYFLLTAGNGYSEMYSFRRSHFQMEEVKRRR